MKIVWVPGQETNARQTMLSPKALKKALKLADNKTAGIKKKVEATNLLAKLGEQLMEYYKATAVEKEAPKKAPAAKKISPAGKTAKIASDPKALVYIDGACRGNGLASPITGIGVYWRWSCMDPTFNDDDDVLEHMSFEDAQNLLFDEYLHEPPDDRWKDRVTNQRAESLALALTLCKLHELYFWRHADGKDTSLRTDRNYIFEMERSNDEERRADAKKQALLRDKGEATICTDSTWTRDCATTWAHNWSRAAEARGTTDWVNGTGELVVHQDIHKVSYAILRDLANHGLYVKIDCVRGHSGVYGNMIVDALARYSTDQITFERLKNEITSLKRGLKRFEETNEKSVEAPAKRTGSITLSSLLNEGSPRQKEEEKKQSQ